MYHHALTSASLPRTDSNRESVETAPAGTGASNLAPCQNICHDREGHERERFRTAYHKAMKPHLKRWDVAVERARFLGRRNRYAEARRRTIAMDPADRLDSCEGRSVVFRCACRHVRAKVGCGLRWLCPRCQKRFYAHYRRKLKLSMKTAQRGTRARWTLVTLTVQHSGSLALDRERIADGWRRFRQWTWRRIGKFPYALVWEFTAGAANDGHLHAHVAALWPYVPWSDMHAEWERATHGHGRHIHFEQCRKGPGGAASYLSKYASKGVQVDVRKPELSTELLAAIYNRKVVCASHGFWRKPDTRCKTCRQHFELEHTCAPLAEIAAGAVLRSHLRVVGVDSERGPPPQTEIGAFRARRSAGSSET